MNCRQLSVRYMKHDSLLLNRATSFSDHQCLFSFTTIDPNRAVGYLQIPCACSRPGVPNPTEQPLSERCKPNYGTCINGTRSVPIELLDVAGLVPGAHEGKGLGNRFLDDLRHADALVHVVDVSGTTDAEGESSDSKSREERIEKCKWQG